jgi:hypothetical protein
MAMYQLGRLCRQQIGLRSRFGLGIDPDHIFRTTGPHQASTPFEFRREAVQGGLQPCRLQTQGFVGAAFHHNAVGHLDFESTGQIRIQLGIPIRYPALLVTGTVDGTRGEGKLNRPPLVCAAFN